MAQNSKIEWTDHTGNLWWGCTKCSEGCNNCYAEYLSETRYKNNVWGNNAPRKLIKSTYGHLDKWQKEAKKSGVNKRVFVGSMMDIFEKPMPVIDSKGNPIDDIDTGTVRNLFFLDIENGRFNNLTFLFLTKRPSNINKMIPKEWSLSKAPDNVWFGTSVSNQLMAETNIRHLATVPGNRFLSVEPLLEEVSLDFGIFREDSNSASSLKFVDWVIVGGESGHNKRPFDPEWARKIRSQCQEHNVPFFMKQWDKIKAIPEDLMIREFPKSLNL